MDYKPKWKNAFEAAEKNDFEAVKYFVNKRPIVLTQTNEAETSVALYAAVNNNFPMLKWALETDDTRLYSGDLFSNNIIQRTIELGNLDTVKYLVEQQGWDVHRRNNRFYGTTPIHHAAEEGQLEILKYLIEERQGDINIRDHEGKTPLFNAAEKPYMNVIKYMVEDLKADVSAVNNKNENVLYVAAMSGDLIVPKYLLDERKIPFDINWKNQQNCTLLFMATRWSRMPFIEYLVNEKHADVNIVDDYQRGPLHTAAYRGNLAACQFLVEHGADLGAKDKWGKTPAEDAVNEKHESTAKYLQDMEQKRNRRSVDNPTFFYSNGPFAYEKPTADSLIGQKNLPAIGEEQYLAETINNKFDSYLVIANTIMMYNSTRYSKQKSKHTALLSPSELIQSRVDPLAVDAVNYAPR